MENVQIKENERIDDLQIKDYRIIQKTDGFCFGIDAVLLSDYARVKKKSKGIDLCSGTGIIPILMEGKYPLAYVEGLEYQEEFAKMAERSVKMNGQEEKVHIVQGDVRNIKTDYERESFDWVTCNPPYMTGEHGLTNPDYAKAIARHEITCSLEDVVKAAKWLLKTGGHFYMVHRPFRLAEIIYTLKQHKLEPKRMRLVHPYVDKEPNMVLIDAAKGGKQRITVEPPLIVYNKDGSYTDEDGQVTVTRDVDQMVRYFNQIRYRAGQPGITAADAADPTTMRELIKHERLIEFAFEGQRFWDLRRWKDAYDAYNKPIRGLDVSAREAQREQFYTERIWNTEKTMKRMFSNKMYLWPLERNVLRKNGKLVQNPGW